jgi:hypothetical protein
MDNTRTLPSVRSHLAAGGAVAGAGLLALGLVAAPPDTNGARADIRPLQLTAFALPPAAHSAALLGTFIVNQAKADVPVIPTVVPGGTTDVIAAGVPTPVTFDSAIDPAITQQVNNAALAAATPAFDWNRDVMPILGPIILFCGIAIGLFVVAPLIYVYDVIAGVLGLPTFTEWQLGQAGASIATADATATTTATLTSDPPLSQSAPVLTAKDGPAEAAPAIETGKADVSPPVASAGPTDANDHMSTDTATLTDTPIHTKQLTSTDTAAATKNLTDTTKADQPSTEPTAVNDPKPSAGASTSESAKPSIRPATPRPVVRGPFGVLEKLRDPSHRRNGGEPTTHAAPTTDKAATTGSNPSGGDSPGGDPGGS